MRNYWAGKFNGGGKLLDVSNGAKAFFKGNGPRRLLIWRGMLVN